MTHHSKRYGWKTSKLNVLSVSGIQTFNTVKFIWRFRSFVRVAKAERDYKVDTDRNRSANKAYTGRVRQEIRGGSIRTP